MASAMDKLAKELKAEITASDERKPKPYDTQAEVVRVEDGTAWVHIPGGVDETPVRLTINARKGDTVNVHVADGTAWITGNSTNPPTDDRTANYAVNIANTTQENLTVLNTVVVDEIEATNAKFANVEADTAKVHNLTADQLNATVGYIGDLTANNVTAGKLTAAEGYISDLTAGNVTAQNIIADHGTIGTLDTTYATIDELHSDYAEIDLANVNNAWIQNGVVKDAAITDAQIIGVSANKLTAGTIDASNITVTNLNASNITTGSITVDGITIDVTNNEASIDGSYIEEGTITLNGLSTEVTDKIDGAIETFTGSTVPTLNNYPASSWTTSDEKASHVGDVYYVLNAGNSSDGYCYRFAKSGNTYQWVLIKDSDVTAALSRLTTAEGEIDGLQTFESTTTSWMTDTDEELTTIRSNVTSLSGRVGDAEDAIELKVDTSTFNTLSQTVGENSANITSLSTITTNNGLTASTNISNTVNSVSQKANSNESKISNLTTLLQTNADGTTASTDIVHQVSAIDQDLDGITTRVSKTEVQIKGAYATSSTAKGTAAKTATITPAATGWELYTGATITVKFTNENTTSSPTLNINSTGAKAIKTYSGGNLSEAEYKWPAGSTFTFTYNGTNWLMQDSTIATRMTSAESSITQNAENIELKVSKDGVISSINQSSESVSINAGKVNISGVITAINDNTTTTINGNKITTGTVSASAINATSGTFDTANIPNLNASKITAGDISADQMKTNSITAINSLTTGKINAARLDVGSITVSSLADGSNIIDDISDAAKMATSYISSIDADGIYISPSSQSPTSSNAGNSAKIDGEGLEIFNNDASVASYGSTSRVGLQDYSHLEIEGNVIRGISSYGYPYFEVSENGASATTQEQTTIYIGHLDDTIDLSTIPLWGQIANRNSFEIHHRIFKDDGYVADHTEMYTFTKGQSATKTRSTYTSPNTLVINALPANYSKQQVYLCKTSTIPTPFYRFGTDVAETGGANSFLMGRGTVASGSNQLAIGKYNEDSVGAIFMVGDGASDASRKNAFDVRRIASSYYNLSSIIYIDGVRMYDFVTEQSSSATAYGDGYWRWREWASGKVEIWYAGSLTLNSTTSTTSGVTRREKWFNFPNSYSLNRCTVLVNGMNAGAWCGCGGVQNSSNQTSDPRRKFEVMAYNISGAPAESQAVNIYICGEKAT